MTKKDDPQIPVKTAKKAAGTTSVETSKNADKPSAGQSSAESAPSEAKLSSASASPPAEQDSSHKGADSSVQAAQSQKKSAGEPPIKPKEEKQADKVTKKKSLQKEELKSAEKSKPASKAKSEVKLVRKMEEIKLPGLYAFKEGMSSIYDDQGRHLPVTFLKVAPWFVSQIKNQDKDAYMSVQLACHPLKKSRSKSQQKQVSAAGFENGARYVREIRQNSVKNMKVGQKLSIHSLAKGDVIKLRSISKGHGFSGVVKRWGFNGGPASHGSKIHRMGGSIGNRTEPARVMPGKKMPGHYGSRQVTVINVQVVDVLEKEQMVIIKGPVPGARNSLVFMYKSAGS